MPSTTSRPINGTSRTVRVAALMILIIVSTASPARADFSGPYAPANWTLFNSTHPNFGNPITANGFVNVTAAPASITLTGSNDNSTGAPFPGLFTDYTIQAVASGTWSFNWSYFSDDSDLYDDGGYLRNGVYTVLAFNNTQGSGSVSLSVNAGDVIGFRVHTEDNSFEPGHLTISNFVAPVPAPGALALLGIAGLVGRAHHRRRPA